MKKRKSRGEWHSPVRILGYNLPFLNKEREGWGNLLLKQYASLKYKLRSAIQTPEVLSYENERKEYCK